MLNMTEPSTSCHPVILSSCHPVILSSCHPVIPAELSFSVTRSYQPIPVIPAKERHPSTVTSPSEGTSPQRRNVTPAKERHPSEGWGWYPEQLDSRLRENDENSAHPRHTSPSPSYQPIPVIPAKERHPSEGWGWYPEQLDSRLRENDKNSG